MNISQLLERYADVRFDEPTRRLDRRFPYLDQQFLNGFASADAYYIAVFDDYNLLVGEGWDQFGARKLVPEETETLFELLDQAINAHQSIKPGAFRFEQVCRIFDRIWDYVQGLPCDPYES